MALLKTFIFIAAFVNAAICASLNITFNSNWCQLDQTLAQLNELKRNAQSLDLFLGMSEILDENDTTSMLSALQLEFFNQLEREESKFYGISGQCRYWVKRFKDSKVSIECEDRFVKEQQGIFDPKEEITEKEQIRYSTFNDKELIVVYAKPQPDIMKEVAQKFEKKNLIQRYIFEECYKIEPPLLPIWQGVGIHFQINHVSDQANLTHDLIWRTIWHKFGKNHKNTLFWKENVLNHYQDVIMGHILDEARNLSTVVDILQNHPNIETGNFTALKVNKSRQAISPIISKDQYVLVNYKVIQLNKWTLDPLFIDKEMKKVKKNSEALKYYTDDSEQLYSNLIKYQQKVRETSQAFMPYFDNSNINYVTISDVLIDKRFKTSQEFDYITTDEYRQKLNIGTNFIQIFLYLDLNTNSYQNKLIQAFANLQEKGVAMQIHLSITSQNPEDWTLIKQIYFCLIAQSQIDQSKTLSILEQILTKKKQLNQVCKSGKADGLNIIVDNSLQVCSNQNICTFPLLLINEHILNQPQLFEFLNKEKDILMVENFLKDSIMNRALFSYQMIKSRALKAPTNFFLFHYKNAFAQYSHIFTYASINDLQFLDSLPTLKNYNLYKLNSNAQVLIQVHSKNQTFISLMEEWTANLRYSYSIDIRVIEQINEDILIRGFVQQGKDYYVFLNGIYLPAVENQWMLQESIELETIKLNIIKYNLNLKAPVFAFMNEINYLGILYELVDNQREYELIDTQFQNQTIMFSVNNDNSTDAPLKIKAKLQPLSKETVVFLSYLHFSQQACDIQITWFISYQIGVKIYDIPYHYYRFIWSEKPQSSFLIDDLNFFYPKIILDIESFRLHFSIEKLDHYQNFLDTDQSSQKQIFGSGMTLEFATEAYDELNDTINIEFQMRQIQTIAEVYQTLSEHGISQFVSLGGFKAEVFTIMNRNQFIEQRLNMENYYQLSMQNPGRYYIKKQGSKQTIKIDFDTSIYQPQSNPILFNLNNKQQTIDIDLSNIYVSLQTVIYNDYLNSQTFNQLKFYFVTTGPLYETLLLQQIYQLVLDIKLNQQLTFFIIENTYVSPQFKHGMKMILQQHPTFEYKFINFAWPSQIVYKPKSFRKQVIYFKVLFTDQVLPVNAHGKVIQKDADQCLNQKNTNWTELLEIPLNGKALGLVPHGYEGVGAENVKEYIELFNLGNSSQYYCSALIVNDIDQMRKGFIGEALRNYYNLLQSMHNYVDLMPLADQGLLNNINRDIPIITPLADEWLWSEDFRSEQSKALAKNIDMQAISVLRDKKLEQAFRICPGYKQTFEQLQELVKKV